MRWILCFLIFTSGAFESPIIVSESTGISEYTCNANLKLGVETKELRRGNRKIGYSIWMNTNSTKVDILAGKSTYSNVNSRFKSWQKNREIVVCTSGGYANNNYVKGVGLTIDKGAVVNRMIANDMDALVITTNDGLEIYDLNQRFRFNTQGSALRLTNSIDKSQFINWAKNEGASVFQTHLLAYESQLNISSAGNTKRAIRKFLVKITGDDSKEQSVIFYLRYPEYLYEGTKKIFDYLQASGYQVDAMINLDTGVNDILEVNERCEKCNSTTIKGRTPLNQATNLLIFYK